MVGFETDAPGIAWLGKVVPTTECAGDDAVLVHAGVWPVWSVAGGDGGMECVPLRGWLGRVGGSFNGNGNAEAVIHIAVRAIAAISLELAGSHCGRDVRTGRPGLLVCWMTRTAPEIFMSQMQADAPRYVLDLPGLLKALVVAEVPLKVAIPGLILIFLIATGWWVVYMGNRASTLDRLAIAGLAARLFTYHRPYDDLLLVFLLVALTVRLMKRSTPSLVMTTLAVGLSLWLPLGFGWKWPFAAIQHLCWVSGAVVLTRDILATPGRSGETQTAVLAANGG